MRYTTKNKRVTDRDLVLFVRQTQGSQMRDEYLVQLIQAMVCDQRLEVVHDFSAGTDITYQSSNWLMEEPSSYGQIPCSYCQVKKDCAPGNKINPESCQYMKKWEEMF